MYACVNIHIYAYECLCISEMNGSDDEQDWRKE